ncbi:MAG: histidine kinase [Luteolibacter sp.]
MLFRRLLPVMLMLLGGQTASSMPAICNLNDLSVGQLERKLAGIDSRLKELAQYSPRIGVGGIGCRTRIFKDPEHPEWMRIDLKDEAEIDQIVLVPVLRRDPDLGYVADAFPTKFQVRVGTAGDSEGTVVTVFDGNEGILPRVAPLVIPIESTQVSWVLIEVESLPLWERTKDYAFQLSEVLLFSGSRNVALGQSASVSGDVAPLNAWRSEFLTDGALPYLINVPRAAGTVPSISELRNESDLPMEIIIDLGERFPVSELHLHAVEQNDTAPQAFAGDFGIPDRFIFESSDSADFSDSTQLLDIRFESVYEKNPLMMWEFPPVECRYVRLTVVEPYKASELGTKGTRVGFAEIAILSNSENVALGKKITGNFKLSGPGQSFPRYVDGLNLYGIIPPLRDWIGELAERHQLELERPLVNEELQNRYGKQKQYLQLAGGALVVLGAGICILFFYGNMLRVRQAARIRERIAANLHDELGANLHAIGLLGDMARRLAKSPEDLDETLERIRGLTERTGTAARHCANMMAAEGICDDLVGEMTRDASRILADLEHDIEIEGEESLDKLKRRTRIDLMLFYKECLINIIRHSGATRAMTRMVVKHGALYLTVDDNGRGFSGETPTALKRRARLMGAKMRVEKSEMGGIQVSLRRRIRSLNFL